MPDSIDSTKAFASNITTAIADVKRLFGYLLEIDDELAITGDLTANALFPRPCLATLSALGDAHRSVMSAVLAMLCSRDLGILQFAADIPDADLQQFKKKWHEQVQGLEEGKTRKGGINQPPTRPRPKPPAPIRHEGLPTGDEIVRAMESDET